MDGSRGTRTAQDRFSVDRVLYLLPAHCDPSYIWYNPIRARNNPQNNPCTLCFPRQTSWHLAEVDAAGRFCSATKVLTTAPTRSVNRIGGHCQVYTKAKSQVMGFGILPHMVVKMRHQLDKYRRHFAHPVEQRSSYSREELPSPPPGTCGYVVLQNNDTLFERAPCSRLQAWLAVPLRAINRITAKPSQNP